MPRCEGYPFRKSTGEDAEPCNESADYHCSGCDKHFCKSCFRKSGCDVLGDHIEKQHAGTIIDDLIATVEAVGA